MDDQHGVLLDALSDLRRGVSQAQSRPDSRDSARTLIDRLMELARLHFASEEQLLSRFAYPGLAAHHAEHQNILSRLAEYSGWLSHRPSAAPEVAESLQGWFVTHFEGCDQLYGPWLRERGVR
jgi:hemerythrin